MINFGCLYSFWVLSGYPKVGSVRSFNYIKTYNFDEKIIDSNKCANIPQNLLIIIKFQEIYSKFFKDSVKPIHQSEEMNLKDYLKSNALYF